jgi:hypothetical protein
VALADVPNVLARLSAMTGQLDMCQRALSEFLEEKRLAFPRHVWMLSGSAGILQLWRLVLLGSVMVTLCILILLRTGAMFDCVICCPLSAQILFPR